jgi:hypothetical protein
VASLGDWWVRLDSTVTTPSGSAQLGQLKERGFKRGGRCLFWCGKGKEYSNSRIKGNHLCYTSLLGSFGCCSLIGGCEAL